MAFFCCYLIVTSQKSVTFSLFNPTELGPNDLSTLLLINLRISLYKDVMMLIEVVYMTHGKAVALKLGEKGMSDVIN